MVGHRRPPEVKDGGNADAGAEVPGVGGYGGHRLGRGWEQQAVKRGLYLASDIGDLGGQRKHHMRIADQEQVGTRARRARCGRPCADSTGSAGCGKSHR